MPLFENNVDPDQTFSQKPTDQELLCSTLPQNDLLYSETHYLSIGQGLTLSSMENYQVFL